MTPEPTLETAGKYPHSGLGDTLVIGPECFISGDGQVISYRGENYYTSDMLAEQAVESTIFEQAAASPFVNTRKLGARLERELAGLGVTLDQEARRATLEAELAALKSRTSSS